MSVFAVIAAQPDPRLDTAVEAKFSEANRYKIAPGQYLVSAPALTSQQVSDLLGINAGVLGVRVLVLLVTGYSGWHSRDMWEWIAVRLAPPAAAAGNS